jgi:hypothetical protein
MSTNIATDAGLFDRLNGIPKVDIPGNLQAAISAGRRMTSILREVVSLRRGAGKLTPNEYFYYRLWDSALSAAEKRRFVGKQELHPMHFACNDPGWYAAAADRRRVVAVAAQDGEAVFSRGRAPSPARRRTSTSARCAGSCGRALRVPPAAAIVVDDQYLALLSAIFEGTARAFPPVKWQRASGTTT